ncbi:MAG: hypothetical protein ACFFDC_20130 [Promethearchaeota archaeon]
MDRNTNNMDTINRDIAFSKIEVDDLRKEVKGKTLQVYLLLARAKDQDFGVREIYHRLGFSSVSVAAYHLNKLESINLVKKNSNNRYQVTELVPLGSYEEFFVLKGKYLPKEIFFLAFSCSSLLVAIIFFLFKMWEPMLTLLFANAILGTSYSLMRFLSIYKNRDEEEEL